MEETKLKIISRSEEAREIIKGKTLLSEDTGRHKTFINQTLHYLILRH